MSHADTPVAGTPAPDETPQKLLDLSTLYPLLIAGVLVLGVVIWQLFLIFETQRWHDGEVPAPAASNWFDLNTLTVPLHLVRTHNLGIDGLKPLNDPLPLGPQAHATLRRNLVVNFDRVVGVEINGEARCYPLRILAWHEVANDRLGGVSIAVTYCPLTDSVRVYEREHDGEERSFRFSGLVYNSNTVFYDSQVSSADRTLWRQIDGVAIGGPGAAKGWKLKTHPALLLPYGEWKEMHPDTTVIDGYDLLYRKCYGKRPYDTYYQGEKLLYPLEPAPDETERRAFTRTLIVSAGEEEKRFYLPELLARSEPSPLRTEVGGVPIEVHYSNRPRCAWVTAAPGATESAASTIDTWAGNWFAVQTLDAPPARK